MSKMGVFAALSVLLHAVFCAAQRARATLNPRFPNPTPLRARMPASSHFD